MKSKEECIRAFSAAGFALIPLDGKKPVGEGWEATPVGRHHEKTLARGNYGIVLGPRDLVLDVDPRNYKAGDRPLDRLAKIIGGIPSNALATRTGGGGLHIFFHKPADLSVRNNLPDFPGLEFKGGPGRQVVGPGSAHPETGRIYELLQGDPAAIPEASAALLALVKRNGSSTFDTQTPGLNDYDDDEATCERCVSYLKQLPGAIQGFHGDEDTYKAACGLRDRGVSPRTAFALLRDYFNPRCVPPWAENELVAKVSHAYTYARGPVGSAHPAAHFTPIAGANGTQGGAKTEKQDEIDAQIGKSGWRLDGKKQPLKCFQNLLNYFSLSTVGLRGVFGYDEFARCVEILKSPPWGSPAGLPVTDIDLQRLRAHLAREHGYDTTIGDIVDAMVDVSQKRRFHPVKDYLTGLRWDGISRLDTWLIKYLGAEDDAEGYTRAVGRKTLTAAVARVFEPGIKFDHVLVLEGKQGLGKSGVCKVLGGPWFADFKMNAGEKDTVQMMQGKWIVEMAELHATRQTDLDTLKAFLTRSVDEARFAYGRLSGRYPRQGIFIATYNPGPDGTYLKDDENRRWWPVRCQGVPPGNRVFDFPGLKSVRDQLWAEALVLYRKGEALTMDTDTLQDAATKMQNARRGEHPWKERIREWISERDKNGEETAADFYTGREVYLGAMGGVDARYTRRESLEIARAMRDLGWEVGYKRKGGELARGYWRRGVDRREKKEVEDQVEETAGVFGDLA